MQTLGYQCFVAKQKVGLEICRRLNLNQVRNFELQPFLEFQRNFSPWLGKGPLLTHTSYSNSRLTVVNSTFVFLSGICANVELMFFKCPPSSIRETLAASKMTLTNRQIEKGFWYYDQNNPWEPKSVTSSSEYSENDTLNIACTQLEKYSEQKKIVKDWCKALPSLENVKYLWFTSQVNQYLFDAVCEMENLNGLFIKWSSIKDINNIQKLKSLKHLHIGSSSQIKDVKILANLTNLETLDLENIKSLTDITAICELTGLQGLGIDGDWGKNQIIETLSPISKLQNLKYITLIGTKIRDQSLKPLAEIKTLERVWTALWFKKSEFEYVYKNLPNLKHGNLIQIMTDEKFCKDNRIKQ